MIASVMTVAQAANAPIYYLSFTAVRREADKLYLQLISQDRGTPHPHRALQKT